MKIGDFYYFNKREYYNSIKRENLEDEFLLVKYLGINLEYVGIHPTIFEFLCLKDKTTFGIMEHNLKFFKIAIDIIRKRKIRIALK